jgi:predicted Ser/Thr protein kinase
MNQDPLIEQYLAGPGLLRRAVAGMTREQLLARPIPGKWSTQEVVCHLADYEPIYADRMKRVIALEEPDLLPGDPGLFAARQAYDRRDLEEELACIELTRQQMARILRALGPEDFQRRGRHSRDGALTLESLLQRVWAAESNWQPKTAPAREDYRERKPAPFFRTEKQVGRNVPCPYRTEGDPVAPGRVEGDREEDPAAPRQLRPAGLVAASAGRYNPPTHAYAFVLTSPARRPTLSPDAAATPQPASSTPNRDTLSMTGVGTEPDVALPLGDDLELLSEVGRGSMGVVYRARQKSLDRTVAVKMLLGEGRDDPAVRARFLNEARAAANLNHPNIVRVFQVGESSAGPYFVMEYLKGHNLAEHLRRGPLRVPAAVSLLTSLANAVHYAHQKGVVHRDLKPGNVVIARGRPVVLDFGLAMFMNQSSALTRPGVIVGTPAFMSPEQARNEADRIGPPTDVYALGGMLYYMLAGRPPYLGKSGLDVALKVVGPEMPPPVREFAPHVPAELEAVCMRCLQKQREDRYPTAKALRKALQSLSDSRPRQQELVLVAEQTGQRLRLTRAVTLVGRAEACKIQLLSQAVSKRHCRLLLHGGRLSVEDLGSVNGTCVNGQPVERAELRAGDRLSIGGHNFDVAADLVACGKERSRDRGR